MWPTGELITTMDSFLLTKITRLNPDEEMAVLLLLRGANKCLVLLVYEVRAPLMKLLAVLWVVVAVDDSMELDRYRYFEAKVMRAVLSLRIATVLERGVRDDSGPRKGQHQAPRRFCGRGKKTWDPGTRNGCLWPLEFSLSCW